MVSDAAKKKAAQKKAAAAARHGKGKKGEDGAKDDSTSALEGPHTGDSGDPLPSGFLEVAFPTALSAQQRAKLHELAEDHSWQHASKDDSTGGRQLVIRIPDGTGNCVQVDCSGDSMADAELAAAVRKYLKVDVNFDAASRPPPGPKKGGKMAPPSLGKSKVDDVRCMEDFVKRMGPLITMEKDAEVALATEAASKGSPETAQRKGRALLNLKCTEAQSGLLGKTLLTLQPNKGPPLPPHKFTPHDVVALKPNKAESAKPPLGQGVVYRVKDDAIVVAMDDVPEEGLEAPLRLEKLANDITYKRLKETLVSLSTSQHSQYPGRDLVPVLFGQQKPTFSKRKGPFRPFNQHLDDSQKAAVELALSAQHVTLLHGPPGTGKTTTVVEIILQEVLACGSKVLVCAASNVAVDNLVERVAWQKGIKAVRIGHPARLLPSVLDSSLDALVQKADNSALAKDVRKEMQQLGTKLLKTKDRRERGDIRRELKRLGKEERQRQQQAIEDVIKDSNVVLTTLTGALSRQIQDAHFDLVIIDEAAQALEIACWSALLKGRRALLAGDHLQLPPTVQSDEAAKQGLSITLFERLARLHGDDATALLTVQYRMHQSIMKWSSDELYDGRVAAFAGVAARKLTDLPHVKPTAITSPSLILIDTAGCSMEETREEEGESLKNEGEVDVVFGLINQLLDAGLSGDDIGVIAPYSAQVGLLKARRAEKPAWLKIEMSTVDGFQGREKEAIIISMVRSNERGEVGFLADARRMNVAVTRAKRQCCIICDTDTVNQDAFLSRMVSYFEGNGEYLSAMEFVK